MIIVAKWFGRLGNNIIQLSNVIDIAMAESHYIAFKVPAHPFFDLSLIERYFSEAKNEKVITDEDNFFYKHRLPYPQSVFERNATPRNALLKKAFCVHNVEKGPDDEVVVHVRSGDVFSALPSPQYVPPPMSYQLRELGRNRYRRIKIVCEDRANPVVRALLRLYKNASHAIQPLTHDIKTILGAANIIQSMGTFVPSLMQLSNNIKFIHPSFDRTANRAYYEVASPWKNTYNQLRALMSYRCK